MSIDKIGKVSAASVKKGSGKNWDQWIKILDDLGAMNWTHTETVDFLHRKYKLSIWWRQGVTHGYQLHKGLRIEGRSLKGDYHAMATRTLPLGPKKIWQLLESPAGQDLWLKPLSPLKLKAGQQFEAEGGIYGEVRTVQAGRRARLRWQEVEWPKPSVVQIHISPKLKNKSILIFSHNGLKDGRIRQAMIEHWKRAVDGLFLLATEA